MQGSYTIGRLAKAAGVPISTVRYYEQRGILSPDARTGSSYRLYGDAALQRLRFIRAAQASGFTLEDIRLLLDLREGSCDPCGEVKSLVERRLAETRVKLEELVRVERVLDSTLRWCRSPRAKGRCQVLDELDAEAAASGKARPRPSAGKKKRARQP